MQLSDVAVRDTTPSDAVIARPRHRGRLTRLAVAAAAASALASASFAGPAFAAHKAHTAASTQYTYTTIDNPGDPTFNQLLGIDNAGEIAGYFGSGAAGHPNTGYTLQVPYSSYTPGQYPGSVQTQVTGLNNHGVTVGFWSGTNMGMVNGANTDANYGFYSLGGRTVSVNFPTTDYGVPAVDQLLGVNDYDIAAGFYVDANGNSHGYTYDIMTGGFRTIVVGESSSVTATSINDLGDVAGFDVEADGNTGGFLQTRTGRTTTIDYPGAAVTQVLGVNNHNEVVGDYQMTTSSNPVGFTWSRKAGFQSISDPNGPQGTVVNGLNDSGELVGFYTDAAGNVHGMLAEPVSAS